MFKVPLSGSGSLLLCCTYVASLAACSPASDSTGNSRGVGSTDRLTATEWSTYVANSHYLQRLTPPNAPVQLNFADPQQYNFALARLKLAGKTAENSPHLFELLEARHQAHVARGLKTGQFVQGITTASDGPQEMHYIEATNVSSAPVAFTGAKGARAQVTPQAAPAPLAAGTASSTFPGGTDYTYVDISISTTSGTPIAPVAYQEQFDNPDGNNGANVTISTIGDPTVSNFTKYTFESWKFEDLPDGDSTASYVHSEIGTAVQQAVQDLPALGKPSIIAPVDTVGLSSPLPDGVISVCMDRDWTMDCDYILDTGSVVDHRIKMPLKGSISLTTAHTFDAQSINMLRTNLNNNVPGLEAGQIKLILANTGGGCNVLADGSINAGMSGFWNFVTLSTDQKTLSWDITGSNAIYFTEGCTQIQNSAKLTMRIPVPVISDAEPHTTANLSFTISTEKVARADAQLTPITLTNSCLAEGTQIEVGGGKLAAIESLHIGQSIFNPYASAGHALTIKDTAKGIERSPMVRIRDAAGHTLLMTEMHPIATPDRGMVQARALRTGDVVMTTQGPSKLTEVSREPYAGQVYNLKVGSDTEMAGLGPDQTVVHANGFVVGDGQIQSKYEALAMKPGEKTVDQLPEQWRRDFLLSPHHN